MEAERSSSSSDVQSPPVELHPRRPADENPFDAIRRAVVGFCDPLKERAEQQQKRQQEATQENEQESPEHSTAETSGRVEVQSRSHDANSHDDREQKGPNSPKDVFRNIISAIHEPLKDFAKNQQEERLKREQLNRENEEARRIFPGVEQSAPRPGTPPIERSPGPDICVRTLFNPLKKFTDEHFPPSEWQLERSSTDDSEDHADPLIGRSLEVPHTQRMHRRATEDELSIPSMADSDEDGYILVQTPPKLPPRPPKGILKDSTIIKRPPKPRRSQSTQRRARLIIESAWLTVLAVALTLLALHQLGYRFGFSLHRKAADHASVPFHFTVHREQKINNDKRICSNPKMELSEEMQQYCSARY